jgi:anti-sigma regulatory factor (Ser/Thr protein kinase)
MGIFPAAHTTLTLSTRQVRDWLTGKGSPVPLPEGWDHAGSPATISLPALRRAVPVCRRLVLVWLDKQGVEDCETRDTVLLAVSELVGNAVLHSASLRVSCVLSVADDHVHIEVCDQNRAASVPHIVHPPDTATDGRGLAILTEISSMWGMQCGPGRRSVWVSVPARLPVARPATAARRRARLRWHRSRGL